MRLRGRYLIVCGIIAAVTVSGYALMTRVVHAGDQHMPAVNLASTQQALSQRMAIAAWSGDHASLSDDLDSLLQGHQRLRHGDVPTGVAPMTSAAIDRQLAEIDRDIVAIQSATERVLTTGHGAGDARGIAADLTALTDHFFLQHDALVTLYEDASSEATALMARMHLAVVLIGLGMLGVQCLLVFEPAARALRTSTRKLRESEQHLALALEGSTDAMWYLDTTTNRMQYSPRWGELLHDSDIVSARTVDAWFEFVASSDLHRLNHELQSLRLGRQDSLHSEVQMKTATGQAIVGLVRAAVSRNERGRVTRVAGSVTDITEQKLARDELRRRAEYDDLTGLLNRSAFRSEIDKAAERLSDDHAQQYAVLFMDFDGFKAINDAFGHSVGDQMLVGIARRIKDIVGNTHAVARLGGDEFAILLHGVDQPATIDTCERLLAECGKPYDVFGQSLSSTASLGVVLSGEGRLNADDTLRDADIAMYEAKARGKNRYQIFDEALRAQALKKLTIESSLRSVSFEDELELLFQPLIGIEDGETAGFEALLRWPGRSNPGARVDEFIPIAEATGVIVEMGYWILEACAAQLRAWDELTGTRKLLLHVNVSKRQVIAPDFTDRLSDLADRYPDIMGRLVLEVTESAVMDDRSSLVSLLRQIRQLGYPLAMDDFGTGHSSLASLREFPLDEVKMDRSFIIDLETSRDLTAIYQSIVSIGQTLNLRIVAEGVETEGQFAQLQAMGCDIAQGYYFAKPLPVHEATEYLRGGRAARRAA